MKNKLFLHIALGFALLLLSTAQSCRPEPIPIKLKSAPQKLVVASQVIPGNIMIIALSKSFDALTYTDTGASNDFLSQILVSRARVTIAYNGTVDTLFKLTDGFYGSISSSFTPGVNYTLKVYDSTTGLSAEAATTMLPQVSIDSAWVSAEINSGDTFRYLYVKLNDPAGSNQYMINLYRNTDFVRNSISNPSSVFGAFGNTGTRTVALTDAVFNQNPHTEKINIDDFSKGDTLTMTLSNISSDYYEYLVQQARAERNGLGAIFGEPVNFTTNVRGGYGFFTAHWPTSRILFIKD